MNIYLTQPEFNESIVRDNIWQWTPIELANHRYPPKFQIHKDDQYVVSFMPRPGLRGLIASLWGKDRVTTVVSGKADGKWKRLFTRMQYLFYEPIVVLVKKKRTDSWYIEYRHWDKGITTAVVYKVKVDSLVDPEKFANFLSYAGNQKKIQKVIEIELLKYLDHMRLNRKDTRCIIDGELDNEFLHKAGYTTIRFTLTYVYEKLMGRRQNN